MSAIYMLDTNICSFIMRERPPAVLDRLQQAVETQNSIAISVITYYEMLLGASGRNASPRHARLIEAFVARLSAILPWDRVAAEAAMRVRRDLSAKGTPTGGNDVMIAGHALASGRLRAGYKQHPRVLAGLWAAGRGLGHSAISGNARDWPRREARP